SPSKLRPPRGAGAGALLSEKHRKHNVSGQRPPPSHPVILRQIVNDHFGVGIVDGRTESLDHLRHFGIPSGRVEKRRVHLDVVEAVTSTAIALHLVEARAWLEFDRLFLGARGGGSGPGDRGNHREDDNAHWIPAFRRRSTSRSA